MKKFGESRERLPWSLVEIGGSADKAHDVVGCSDEAQPFRSFCQPYKAHR